MAEAFACRRITVMPPSIGDVCREHLRFMEWADNLLLAAVAKDVPDRIDVMRHIYLGELVWLRRVQGESNAQLTDVQPPADVGELQRVWPGLHRGWMDWADAVADWTAIAPYRNMQGVDCRSPVWPLL